MTQEFYHVWVAPGAYGIFHPGHPDTKNMEDLQRRVEAELNLRERPWNVSSVYLMRVRPEDFKRLDLRPYHALVQQQEAAATESKERAEYERLKAKFEPEDT